MKILIYKRTHVGDPDGSRQFGNEGCMGRVRGFDFDAVIGIGGNSLQPRQQGLSGKINWIGRNPARSANPIDSRGPLVSFKPEDFRLFEQQGPLLEQVSPKLAKKIYGNRARFLFSSLSPAEQEEAKLLIARVLDEKAFDHLRLDVSDAHENKKMRRRCKAISTCNQPRKRKRCLTDFPAKRQPASRFASC